MKNQFLGSWEGQKKCKTCPNTAWYTGKNLIKKPILGGALLKFQLNPNERASARPQRSLRRQTQNHRSRLISKITKTTFRDLLLTIGGGYLLKGVGYLIPTPLSSKTQQRKGRFPEN